MIKNKSILEEIRKKKNQIECSNCKFCNLNAFYKGAWYCNKRSVFDIPTEIEECFERKS
jgi:hypothetical protein